MNINDFEAYWNDCLAQKAYSVYQGEGEEAEYIGLINGHDADHAISKMAQHEEIDPATLTATRTWPDSNH